VGINGKKSESFQTYRGVKQGSDSLHCCSTWYLMRKQAQQQNDKRVDYEQSWYMQVT
jgi:hypothetical protein